MSDHACYVVPVSLSPHPNADKLAMVNGILGGYCCGVSKADFADVTKAAFIPPDSLVPVAHPDFSFLKGLAYRDPHPYAGFARITVKKFRGLYSDGLLVKVPEGMPVGADAAEFLGVKHYEPIEQEGLGAHLCGDAAGIDGFGHKYDIENLRRHADAMLNRQVIATEKLHGCNARYQWRNGVMHCGSRSHWKKPGTNVWWAALTPQMVDFCMQYPHMQLFGEVVGKVQKGFDYSAPGDAHFVAFDVDDTQTGTWLEHDTLRAVMADYGIPTVPELYRGAFQMNELLALAEGPSVLAPAGAPCREGVVVKATPEARHPRLGRLQFKLVGNGYYEATK
jgi:RNA ligase (TIGR02306 family)